MAPVTRSGESSNTEPTRPQRIASDSSALSTLVTQTSEVIQEADNFIENLRSDIEARRVKNNLLAEAALEYRREFGDDL
jgi:hypothetical protein